MIPVVYIHFGKVPDYLVTSIECAAIRNKEIVFITDSAYKNDKIRCLSLADFSDGLKEFEMIYEHMSTNTAEFEKACIKRWFVLRNYMNAFDAEVCYYSDSDVMIYDDLNNTFNNYKSFDAAYTLSEKQAEYEWAASACCSYWKKNTIAQFCEFIISVYKTPKKVLLAEKWEFHLKNNIKGGICDMTLLYLFSKEINFFSLSKVIDDACFDRNLLISENYYESEYAMAKRFGEKRFQKKIAWKNGLPYGYNTILKKNIRFIALTEYAKLIKEDKNAITLVLNGIKNVSRRIKHKMNMSLTAEKQ